MITLFHAQSVASGQSLRLSDEQARHVRVRRAAVGDALRLVDGRGHIATGRISAIGKHSVDVDVGDMKEVAKPMPLEVLVPVADRDRMLLAAEKCVELQVTGWRPVFYARSRSVSPRGEGPRFREKVQARMQSALEQSGGAWMPVVHEDAEWLDALRSVPSDWDRILFDASGEPFRGQNTSVPTSFAVGPEGGLESGEVAAARDAAWRPASLAGSILRFETAVIAAAAVIRATQLLHRS